MITIFSIPKPFTDPHIATIQTNAIKSWTKIEGAEVILMGDEPGLEEAAKELKVRLIKDVKYNEHGTPMLDSAFQRAREESKYSTLAFVNTDIILFSDFIKFKKRIPQNKKFLIIGERWDMEINNLIDYSKSEWSLKLKNELSQRGKKHQRIGSDYFIFQKNSYKNIPSFAVGRNGWDNWMIYEARRRKMMTIDASESITIIHQDHDYKHLKNTGKNRQGSEAINNIEMSGGKKHMFVLEDANWVLKNDNLVKKYPNFKQLKAYLKETPEILPGPISVWEILSKILLKIYRILLSLQTVKTKN